MQEINLYQLIKFYAKKWMWIVLFSIIGLIGGYVYNAYIQTPLYKSEATLILISPENKTATQDTTLINNYIELFKSRRVLEPVIAKLNLNTTYEDLINLIEATNVKNTEVINVSISTENAERSRLLVDGAIDSFKEQVNDLYEAKNVQVVDSASVAASPYNVHKELLLIMTTAAGFIMSVIILFFVFDFSMSKKGKVIVKKNLSKKSNTIGLNVKATKTKQSKAGLKKLSTKISSAISKSTKVRKLKKQAAKLVKINKLKLLRAKNANKAELAKINKAKQIELATAKKANKLELANIKKLKKAKKAKAAKAKKAKIAKINKELKKIRTQARNAKLANAKNNIIHSIKTAIKPVPKKQTVAKSNPTKKANSKKAIKTKSKNKTQSKSVVKKGKQNVFYSSLAPTLNRVFSNNPRIIKRERNIELLTNSTELAELPFIESTEVIRAFEPKHGKGIISVDKIDTKAYKSATCNTSTNSKILTTINKIIRK